MFGKKPRVTSGQLSDNYSTLMGGNGLFTANPQSSSEDGAC